MMATYGVHENGLCMWHNVGKKLCGKGSNGSTVATSKNVANIFVLHFEKFKKIV